MQFIYTIILAIPYTNSGATQSITTPATQGRTTCMDPIYTAIGGAAIGCPLESILGEAVPIAGGLLGTAGGIVSGVTSH